MGRKGRAHVEAVIAGKEKPKKDPVHPPKTSNAICGKCFIRGGNLMYSHKTNMFEHVGTCPQKK